MDFSGEYRIPAPPRQVWDALVDPATLAACIPGCRELTRTSETGFAAVVAAKVGPISATFRGTVSLLDLDPPRGYTLSGQGQGGAAGFARMTARVTLAEDGSGTLLRYDAHADIGGKLATVGSRLVQSVARRQADEFFAAFAQRLGGEAAAPGVAAEAVAAQTVAMEATGGRETAAPQTAGREPGPQSAAGSDSDSCSGAAAAPSPVAAAPLPRPARDAIGVAPRASVETPLPAWVIALVAGGCGVVLGFVLGRF